MSTAKDLVKYYVGEANKQRDPIRRSQAFRRGATHFARLASVEKDPRISEALSTIGLSLVGESMKEVTISDFTQILRDTAAAVQELGPNAMLPGAALDTTAQQRQDVASQPQPGQVGNVCIQPASFNNPDVTLGRTATVTFAPTPAQIKQGIVQSQTVAFWQGNKRESTAMSVDFGTVLAPVPKLVVDATNPTVDGRLYADIQYGADGNTQNTVRVDVGLGRRITVVGNYISVVIGMDPPSVNPGSTSPILTAGASIGTFGAVANAPVTRTVYIDQIAGAFTPSPQFNIPARATMLLPPTYAGWVGGQQLTVNWYGYSGVGIGGCIFTYGVNNPFTPVYIPVDAFAFNVAVSTAIGPPALGAGVGIRIPFQLSL